MQKHRLAAIAAAMVTAAPFPIAAQADTLQPEVVVTATRSPITADASLASVSVIDRSAIERAASRDLVELLRGQPGVDIVRGGGLGQQASVFMRGSNSNHVLVLIDGVRVASANTGGYAWEHLPIGQIERIEIVRGPRAALWGSDAIGGVIQIFTRRDAGADVAILAGNHDTYGAEAGFGTRTSAGGFGARAGYVDSAGINAQNPEGFAFDPDDDGFLLRSLSLWGEHTLGSQQFSATLISNDNEVEFDQGESTSRNDAVSLALDGELGRNWSHRLSLAHGRETLETPDFFNRFETRRQQLDWVNRLELGARSELVGGLSWLREEGANIDTFSGTAQYDQRRNNRAGFLSWHGSFDAHRLELSGRHDDNSAFGSETTFQGAWGWRLSDSLRTLLSYGEGFRAPNLNELYSPGFGGLFAGNPELSAEASDSVELGLDWRAHAAGGVGVRAFRTDIDGLIDFSGGETFFAVNIARARIEGIEATVDWQVGAWQLDAGATLQDAINAETGADLLRRPGRKASIAAHRQFDGGSRVGVEVFAAGARPDSGGELPGYGIVSLSGSVPLAEGWSLDARVDNLLDREYTEVRGFNTPGLTGLLTLRWQRQ
jgi:vitamin B12 transporter